MKKFLIIFLSVAMFLPLHAQDGQQWKEPFSFARRHFEIGFDVSPEFSNDLFGVNDVFKSTIDFDINKYDSTVGDDGINAYIGFFGGMFLNIKNLKIGGGLWDFGFYSGAEGSVRGNLPKSIITLMAKGNYNQPYSAGMISASGSVSAEAGIRGSAKYGKLRIGVNPGVFAPLIYMPKSGINYVFNTEEDQISLTASGYISVYSPFMDNGELKFGSDLSVEGEYALFSFLDLGGIVSHIPLAPAKLKNRMKLTLTDVNYVITGQDLIDGTTPDFPDIDFNEEYDTAEKKFVRPLRFDVYARLKPFGSELLVLKPNIGFTADISEDETFFNMGIEAKLNLISLFIPYVSINREDGIWKNRLGFAFNLRAFELDLEAALQSQTFKESFAMKGFSVGLGLRLGW